MVRAIMSTDVPAYYITTDQSGEEKVVPSKLYEHLKYLPQLEPFYLKDVQQCKEHRALRLACLEIGLEFSLLGPVAMNADQTGYLSTPQTVNALVACIRRLYDRPIYPRRRRYSVDTSKLSSFAGLVD